MAQEDERPSWLIEPLGRHHNCAAFSCGRDVLDHYLKRQAGQDARRHVAAPFVLVERDEGITVLGYYTLSAFSVNLGDLPEETAKKLPHYPAVPSTLLGRLAVDQRCRGQGAGEFLLMDALYRACQQSSEIAAAAFVVDAMDEEAWRFYRYFDFIPFPERRDRLFLPMNTVAALFSGNEKA